MEYWEFLLQREGDRTWQPIKAKTEIAAGRYRVVAHSSRINTDVEICVTHESLDEIPPKRRSQKRSRRTNLEGLMVVIPFTYLKPGRWELRCCGDIMSDFLGNSWQHGIQILVLPKHKEVAATPDSRSPVIDAEVTEVQADQGEPRYSTPDFVISIESTPTEVPQSISLNGQEEHNAIVEVEETENTPLPIPVAENPPSLQSDETHPDLDIVEERVQSKLVGDVQNSSLRPHVPASPCQSPPNDHTLEEPTPEPCNETLDQEVSEVPSPSSLSEASNSSHPETASQPDVTLDELITASSALELNENTQTPEDSIPSVSTSANPFLDQSLEMIEQILQQVLDPVMEELRPTESIEPSDAPVWSEAEYTLGQDNDHFGLILTLDEESLVARQGEPLTLSGQIDILDVNGGFNSNTPNPDKIAFQGSLRYELRDPQALGILVDVQYPLPLQSLPIAFNHTLEIPPDCKTRLILGKVTLCNQPEQSSQTSTPVALASQPFMVTVDLEQLLGAIIPETRAMPIAKMVARADDPSTLQNGQNSLPGVDEPPAKQKLLDWIDVTQNRLSTSFSPSSGSPLPPQIYQPTSQAKASKSLQLPKLPKLRPITESVEPSPEQTSIEQASSSPLLNVEALRSLIQPSTDSHTPLIANSLLSQSHVEGVTITPTETETPVTSTPPSASVDVKLEAPTESSDNLTTSTPIAVPNETPANADIDFQIEDAIHQLEEAISQIREASSVSRNTDILQKVDIETADGETLEHNASSEEGGVSSHAEDETLATPELQQQQAQSSTEQSEDIDLQELFNDLETTDSSLAKSTNEVEEKERQNSPNHDESASSYTSVDPVSTADGLENAFQSLKLQDRFWSRLNSMATDAQLSQWLQSEPSTKSNSPDDEDETPPSEPELISIDVEEVTQPLTSNLLLTDFEAGMWEEQESDDFTSAIADTDVDADTEPLHPPLAEDSDTTETELSNAPTVVDITDTGKNWSAQDFEFVVDDDDEQPSPEPPTPPMVKQKEVAPSVPPTPKPTPAPSPPAQSQPQPVYPRQVERPIPAPELSIPTHELVPGEPVTIRVKLPPHPARLCVKLWLQDRQSRSLLDGPRWLMDLIPDRTGEQEALTQLTVPFGSVEIRFEAIAVDIDSQRESHKVAVDCTIVPPDLPDFSLDEFGI
jgi:flagellar motility protein MotE (MotC chaperone)